MTTLPVRDANNAIVDIEKPLAPGRANAADSRPVALSAEDFDALGPAAAMAYFTQISMTFFTARTTDGGDTIDWTGGPGLFSVYGPSWGTATVQLAYSPDAGATYIDTDGALFTANATLLVSYPVGKVRATVATASGPTSLTAKLQSTR